MSLPRIIKHRSALARSVDRNWSQWMRVVRELPDIRAEKVRRTRQAIADRAFDADAILDAAIDRLSNDLGVLYRRDKDEDEPDDAARV